MHLNGVEYALGHVAHLDAAINKLEALQRRGKLRNVYLKEKKTLNHILDILEAHSRIRSLG